MKPEALFLRYAFPCSLILKQRKEIDDQTLTKLENSAINNIPLEKKLLEKIYFRAFSRIKALAKELNKDYWDPEVIKQYFLVRHNELLAEGKNAMNDAGLDVDKNAPKFIKDLCRVEKAKIIKKGPNYHLVEFNNKKRVVSNKLLPNAEINNIVTIHYGYAIEIVS